MHILEADGIELEFNGRKILSGVHLTCATGKITGLLGRNGQGKSCLMNIIYGSIVCEKSVRFDHVPQKFAFRRPDLLLYLPQFNFIPGRFYLKRVFKDFELSYSVFEQQFPEFASKHSTTVGSLSGGERRLVELYVILKTKSQFALLDEPFTHLNPIQIEKVKELMREEKKQKGVLITDHMYQHVVDVCDNLYVLANGRTYLTTSIKELDGYGYTSTGSNK